MERAIQECSILDDSTLPMYEKYDFVDIVMNCCLDICLVALDVARKKKWLPKKFLVAQLLPEQVFIHHAFKNAFDKYPTFPFSNGEDTLRKELVLIDEAQALQTSLRDKFVDSRSARGSSGKRSLLRAVYNSSELRSRVVYAGTGISMTEASKSLRGSDTTSPRPGFISPFSMWEEDDVRKWLGRFTEDVDETVVPWLVGRARWSTVVVKHMYSGLTMHAAFKKLCTDQFGDANNGRGLLYIVRRMLSRHSNEDQDHEIRNCLVANAVKYMFYGQETTYSGENRNKIIEWGLGYSIDADYSRVNEPLVLNALFLNEMLSLHNSLSKDGIPYQRMEFPIKDGKEVGVANIFSAFVEKYLARQDVVVHSAMEWCVVFLLFPLIMEGSFLKDVYTDSSLN